MMLAKRMKRPDRESHAPAERGRSRRPLDAGFDRWLDRQLHKIYDPVLNENVPDDLLRLLEKFEERATADESSSKGS
jgi:hypothetical protein